MKSQAQAQQAYRDAIPKATTNFGEGVNNYNGDWAGRTTQQKQAMMANLQAAWSRGDWERGIQNKGTDGWKRDTQAKLQNYGVGLNAGADRFSTAIGKIIQAESNIVGSLPPRGTFEQNKARATAVMDGLHALKGQLGA